VSSTISDLKYLRDIVRETIEELAYCPIMSEYGDIGYSTGFAVEESCIQAIENCHIAILIIGKRYGSIRDNGLSITHNEFRKAKQLNIPIIILVNKEVLTYKTVFDNNPNDKNISYPGMEHPVDIFNFINEIENYPRNNGYISFENTDSVRLNLKKQVAHLFGKLLQDQYGKFEQNIIDVLTEIKTLRYELLKGKDYTLYLRTFSKLLKRSKDVLVKLIEIIYPSLEESIEDIINHDNFGDFIKNKGWSFIEVDRGEIRMNQTDKDDKFLFGAMGGFNENYETALLNYGTDYIFKIYSDKRIIGNVYAYKLFNREYNKIK
jgi:hypothetical protein